MMQIDVDIFEPQGISKLDAQASFLPKEQMTQLIKKSFSGKEVHGMAGGGGRPSRTSQSVPVPYGVSKCSLGSRQGLQAFLRVREAGVLWLVSQGNLALLVLRAPQPRPRFPEHRHLVSPHFRSARGPFPPASALCLCRWDLFPSTVL